MLRLLWHKILNLVSLDFTMCNLCMSCAFLVFKVPRLCITKSQIAKAELTANNRTPIVTPIAIPDIFVSLLFKSINSDSVIPGYFTFGEQVVSTVI